MMLRPIPHRKFDWQFSWFFWFLVLQNELRSLRKFFGFCRGGKPLLQILHVCEVDFCNFANVQNYSTNLTVFALRKGPTGLFGGNRDFFTNKEAYWATSIGSNGPFDSNFSGRFDSNFRNLWQMCPKNFLEPKSGEKPPLIIAHSPLTNSAHFRIPTFRCGMGLNAHSPCKFRTFSDSNFPVWNGS